jgi:hypothetical protein
MGPCPKPQLNTGSRPTSTGKETDLGKQPSSTNVFCRETWQSSDPERLHATKSLHKRCSYCVLPCHYRVPGRASPKAFLIALTYNKRLTQIMI